MASATYTLHCDQGGQFKVEIAFKQSSGLAYDLTGKTARGSVGTTPNATDNLADFTITPSTLNATGIIYIALTTAQTIALQGGMLYYDLWIKDGTDDPVFVMHGPFIVNTTITRPAVTP